MSKDFTQGYGPEVYVNKAPVAGKYEIKAKYFANHNDSALTGTTSAVLYVVENMGDFATEKLSFETVRLQKDKQMQNVFEVHVPKSEAATAAVIRRRHPKMSEKEIEKHRRALEKRFKFLETQKEKLGAVAFKKQFETEIMELQTALLALDIPLDLTAMDIPLDLEGYGEAELLALGELVHELCAMRKIPAAESAKFGTSRAAASKNKKAVAALLEWKATTLASVRGPDIATPTRPTDGGAAAAAAAAAERPRFLGGMSMAEAERAEDMLSSALQRTHSPQPLTALEIQRTASAELGPERSRSGELRRSVSAAEKEQVVLENMEAERELALVKAEIEALKAQLNN